MEQCPLSEYWLRLGFFVSVSYSCILFFSFQLLFFFGPSLYNSFSFTTTHDNIVTLRQVHMRSVSSLRGLPKLPCNNTHTGKFHHRLFPFVEDETLAVSFPSLSIPLSSRCWDALVYSCSDSSSSVSAYLLCQAVG